MRPSLTVIGLVVTLVALSASDDSPHTVQSLAQPANLSCVSGQDVACTTLGAVRGVGDGDLVAYKGIPYAQPPVGPLRWRAPQPPTPWNGIRDGSHYGPPCPQLSGKDVIGNEDCLTLNVWTPRAIGSTPLPVMLYLTGGGNHAQSGEGRGDASFVGTNLVPKGVLLVTVNVRLGALGFLTLPALDAEDRRHVSGNYGNLDYIATLQWVQQNIRAFGGNPNQVFLFGTSAGGANICGLMTSPLAKGLFHGAAMESAIPSGCEFQTTIQAQTRTGARLLAGTECDAAPAVLACLRAKTPEELVLALPAITNLFPRTYGPVIDGYVFPDQPRKLLAAGSGARIPVIVGNNFQESVSWMADIGPIGDDEMYEKAVERVFGAALRNRIVGQYPSAEFPSPRDAFIRATTDAIFTCAARRVAQAIVGGGGGPVFRYYFTYRSEAGRGGEHSAEIPDLFQSWTTYTPGSQDRSMSDQLIQFWTQMAKTGNPVSNARLEWRPVTRQASPYLELNSSPSMRQGDADVKCGFWDSVTLPSPHL